MDLTDATVTSQLRRSPDDTLVAEFSVAIGDDPTTGKAVLSLPAVSTAEIEPGDYVFDVQVDVGGKRQTFGHSDGGPAYLGIVADVTREEDGS